MEEALVWQAISMFGDVQYWIGLVIGAFLIYIVLPAKEKKKVGWVVFALIPAAIFAFQLSYVLKLWFEIPRPCTDMAGCPTSYSFPSSHAAVIFAFAVVTSLNIKKRFVWLGTVALAVLVAYSRLALKYHTPLDVAAGSLVGVFSGFIIYQAYKAYHSLDSDSEKSNLSKDSPKSRLSRFLGF